MFEEIRENVAVLVGTDGSFGIPLQQSRVKAPPICFRAKRVSQNNKQYHNPSPQSSKHEPHQSRSFVPCRTLSRHWSLRHLEYHHPEKTTREEAL